MEKLVILAIILYGSLIYGWQPPYSASGVIYPRLGMPAFIQPAGMLNITFTGAAEVQTVEAYNLTHELQLEIVERIEGQDLNTLLVKLPASLAVGLYSLRLYTDGNFIEEPNCLCVWVPDDDILILHATDLHFSTVRERMGLETYSPRYYLNMLIQEANALKPDLVIMTGDNTDSQLEEDHAEFRRLLSRFNVPVLLVIGNHDFQRLSPELFITYQGPDHGVVDLGWLSIYTISTDDGKIVREHLDWLNHSLQENEDRKIVCFHHPPVSLNESDSRGLTKLLRILSQGGVEICLHGHMHVDMVEKYNGITYVTTESITYSQKHHCRLIRIVKDKPIDYKTLYTLGSFLTVFTTNDGSMQVYLARASNPTNQEITLYPTVKLEWTDMEPIFEGAETLQTFKTGNTMFTVLKVSMKPGEERQLRVYYQRDEENPVIENPTVSVVEDKLNITFSAVDRGWGVMEVKVEIEGDVTLSHAVKPKDGRVSALIKVGDRWRKLTVNIVVKDYAGNTATWSKEIERGNIRILLLATLAAVCAGIVAGVSIRRAKRKAQANMQAKGPA